MSSLPAHEGDVTDTVPDPGLGVNLQAEEGAGEPKLLNCLPNRPPFRTFDSRASTTQALEDEITILEDVDIDVVIPSKLSALDFPKAEDGHEEDVAKVIRKSFSKLGVERHAQSDPLAVLAHGALSLHLSWQAQVEAAVQHQDDDFWQRVRLPANFKSTHTQTASCLPISLTTLITELHVICIPHALLAGKTIKNGRIEREGHTSACGLTLCTYLFTFFSKQQID